MCFRRVNDFDGTSSFCPEIEACEKARGATPALALIYPLCRAFHALPLTTIYCTIVTVAFTRRQQQQQQQRNREKANKNEGDKNKQIY